MPVNVIIVYSTTVANTETIWAKMNCRLDTYPRPISERGPSYFESPTNKQSLTHIAKCIIVRSEVWCFCRFRVKNSCKRVQDLTAAWGLCQLALGGTLKADKLHPLSFQASVSSPSRRVTISLVEAETESAFYKRLIATSWCCTNFRALAKRYTASRWSRTKGNSGGVVRKTHPAFLITWKLCEGYAFCIGENLLFKIHWIFIVPEDKMIWRYQSYSA